MAQPTDQDVSPLRPKEHSDQPFQVTLRFYGNLNDFLPPERQQQTFTHPLKEHSSVKDTIEAVGIPHPEVDLILVNACSVGFDYLLQPGDAIAVYPQQASTDAGVLSKVRPQPLEVVTFVLDVHLGKLATYLRFLGFDTLYRNDFEDEELALISSQQKRMLLTQDLGLLKRSIVTYGYRVRSPQPKVQIKEVLDRFSLYDKIVPFHRCSRCNGQIEPVAKTDVEDKLPHFTALYYTDFFQCQSCHQVYWKGAHYKRMNRLIAELSEQSR